MATQQGGAEVRCDDKAPTLTAAAGMSGNNQPVICLCMATGQGGAEITENIVPTLNCNQEQPIICLTFPEDVANTLLGKGQLSHTEVYDARGNGDGQTVPTLTGDHENRVTDYTAIVLAVDCRSGTIDPEINGTLQAKPNGGQSLNMNNVVLTVAEDGTILVDGQPCVLVKLLVRRLTPLECERLQGYPDGWTDIGPWIDSNGKFHKESSDSARYKALGNSIALPPWKWVLKRLCGCYERDATMASLFDGIGGFPLLWEQLNGKGNCLWASEIEPFPVAVTRYRFGDED